MKTLLISIGILFIAIGGWWYWSYFKEVRYSDTEAGFEEVPSASQEERSIENGQGLSEMLPPMGPAVEWITSDGRVRWGEYWREFTPEEKMYYANWQRPPGPLRVGLQVGHWQLADVPEELEGLKASSGAQGPGISEQEVVLNIAQRTKTMLEAEGIIVDLLPATVPVDYVADAFVSIHADGNGSQNVSGFKISGPRRDFSGKADALVDALYASYEVATGLRRDQNVTRRMSAYYAFNWRRYDHAVHPLVPAVIVETGFVTSPTDRAVIVAAPERAAEGIAKGILEFLK